MPMYDWKCEKCGYTDSIYLRLSEYDERKDEKIVCPKCGEDMSKTFSMEGVSCNVSSKQAYRPETCRECRNKVIMDAPYPRGCSKGTRCKGFYPLTKDSAKLRRVTRKQYDGMARSGKVHFKKGAK